MSEITHRIKEFANQLDLLWKEATLLRERIDRTWNAVIEVYGLGTGGTSGYNPDTPPASPSAYDDEFGSTTLNAKWTPINCSAGTVALLASELEDGVYDLTTFDGNIALQPMRDFNDPADFESYAAMIEQTVDLDTNCKFVAKASLGAALIGDSTVMCGIMISGVDGFDDDNFIIVGLGFGGGLPAELAFIQGKAGGTSFNDGVYHEGPYLMILKTGSEFTALFSNDGKAWCTPYVDGYTSWELGLTTGVKFRAFALLSNNSEAQIAPIGALDFVRYFANNTPLANA